MPEKTRIPASEELLVSMDKYWRAANYLSACQLGQRPVEQGGALEDEACLLDAAEAGAAAAGEHHAAAHPRIRLRGRGRGLRRGGDHAPSLAQVALWRGE